MFVPFGNYILCNICILQQMFSLIYQTKEIPKDQNWNYIHIFFRHTLYWTLFVASLSRFSINRSCKHLSHGTFKDSMPIEYEWKILAGWIFQIFCFVIVSVVPTFTIQDFKTRHGIKVSFFTFDSRRAKV